MNQQTRVMCDMRTALDTPEERTAEYQRLFRTALCGRERTGQMVRFRFRLAAVDQAQVRNLAAKEQACCPFFDTKLCIVDDQLWWETRVGDNPEARILLEEFYRLPEQHAVARMVVDGMIDRGLVAAAAHRS